MRLTRPVILGEDHRIHHAHLSTTEDMPPLRYRVTAHTACGLSNLESHGPVRTTTNDPTCPVCVRRRNGRG